MDINRLNEFLILSKCLNFSKAANMLYMTQPVLSRHINDLEDMIGGSLFLRDTHNVKLTTLGELFSTEIEEVLIKYNEVMEHVKFAINNSSSKLSIGYLLGDNKPFFSEFFLQFSKEHPNIILELHEYKFEELLYRINEDKIDVVFLTHINSSTFEGIESKVILSNKIKLIVNRNHQLAEKTEITLKEISGIPMISLDKKVNPTIHDFHKDLLVKNGYKFNLVQEVANLETALYYVSMDKGAFLMPSQSNELPEDLVGIPINDKNCFIDLNLVYRKNNKNPAIVIFSKAFFKFMGSI